MQRMGGEFAFTHFVMILKLHKQHVQSKTKHKNATNDDDSDVLFTNAEEELMCDVCPCFFTQNLYRLIFSAHDSFAEIS